MKTSLPTNLKLCVNCRNWGGCRRPNAPLNTVVEFEMTEKGLCYKTNLEMHNNQSCSKFEPQFRR